MVAERYDFDPSMPEDFTARENPGDLTEQVAAQFLLGPADECAAEGHERFFKLRDHEGEPHELAISDIKEVAVVIAVDEKPSTILLKLKHNVASPKGKLAITLTVAGAVGGLAITRWRKKEQ